MLKFSDKINKLPGIGPAFKSTLTKLSIFNVGDLIYHIPFRYIDFSKHIPINSAQLGQLRTFEGTLTEISMKRSFKSKLTVTNAILSDKTGNIKIVWFNQPYIVNTLHKGQQIIVAGKVEQYNQLQLVNPLFEVKGSEGIKTGRLLPVYKLTAKLTNIKLLKVIDQAFRLVEINDYLPASLLKKFKLFSLENSLTTLHDPKTLDNINQAKLRLAVDDSLPQQLAVIIKQNQEKSLKSPKINIDLSTIKNFITSLPFTLTPSQKRSAWDILQDLNSDQPMSRLLQGDVSSGKTIIAIIAALSVSTNRKQVVILAPTEILARQHYQTFLKFLHKEQCSVALLTQNFSEHNHEQLTKEDLIVRISENKISVIIGTHAILQDHIHIPKLALVVIDEQHRFGVFQRGFLTKQGKDNIKPHLLTMSATPIPRTLAQSLYGNLSVSQLLHIPTNRKKIETTLIDEKDRNQVYQKIKNEVKDGRQAFIITPRVETSQTETKSVKDEFARLQKDVFPDLKLGLIFGKMNGSEKDQTMLDFASGKFDILVATTVIEIGIDIPNATVMLIEGAENFGLAQLHQLRGRVGRSDHQSYCYVFTSPDIIEEVPRLKVFSTNTDGFALAEYDLKTRGFGDLYGIKQSGYSFKFPQFITAEALKISHQIALALLSTNSELTNYPELKKSAETYLKSVHFE